MNENNRTSMEWMDTFFYCDANAFRSRPKLKKQRTKRNRAIGKILTKKEIKEQDNE